MRKSLSPKLAALLVSALTSMLVPPQDKLRIQTPFGPCGPFYEWIDIGFMPKDALPVYPGSFDLTEPCFGAPSPAAWEGL